MNHFIKEMKKYDLLIVLGVQGSGKGTQADLLVKNFGFVAYSAGQLLRDEVASGSELGKEIDVIINQKGELVPAEVIRKLILQALEKAPKDTTVIIDGYPRSLEQLEDFDAITKESGMDNYAVLDIAITDDVAIERLTSRVVLDENGNEVKRADDDIEKIKTRLKWSHDETRPVMDEFEKRGKLIRIDGEQSIEEVYDEVVKKLEL
jgi:adenylate kinase